MGPSTVLDPETASSSPSLLLSSSSSSSSIPITKDNGKDDDKDDGQNGKDISNLSPSTVIDPETGSSSSSSSSSITTPLEVVSKERHSFMNLLLDREYISLSL